MHETVELPDNCIMVWQDNGSTSIMENALYELDPEQSNGIYYHIAYCDNQYVQWVNPEIIRQEVVKSYDATANEYILYNVGDMREIPLSMYVGMKVAWDTQRWKYDETIEDTCTEDWLRLQYGEQQLEEIKGIYDDYYALERDMRCGPIYEVCLNLMKQAVSPDKDREWFAQQTFVEGGRFQVSPEKMKEKESKWDALLARAQACYEKMPEGSGKKFFYNNMMLHILTSQNMNDYGLHLYAAFQAIGASDQEKTVSELDAALASLQAIDAARIPASQGKWENWFRGDDAGAWRDHGWGFSSKRFEERADTLKARFAQ